MTNFITKLIIQYMSKTLSLILLLVFGLFFIADAQENKILPVSPESATLAKFINFPVNYSTGVPNISIPLFEIKSGDLSLPLTLNYHAGGIKVNEKSTWVGLGWNLSAEPQITRVINNIPDETPTYGFLFYNPATANGYRNTQYYQSMVAGQKDEDPDEFFYQLSGSSGRFYLTHDRGTSTAYIATLPFSPIKVNIFQGDTTTITDIDGTYYRFGKSLTGAIAKENSMIVGSYPTTWKCTEMISPTKKDTIFFSYGHRGSTMNVNFNETMQINDNLGSVGAISATSLYIPITQTSVNYISVAPYLFNSGPRLYSASSTYSTSGLYVPQYNPYPTVVAGVQAYGGYSSAITSSTDSTIKVNKITSRSGTVWFYQHPGLANILDSIRVLDYSGKWIKSVRFVTHEIVYPSYASDVRVILDSLIISGNDGKPVEKYAFDYYSGKNVPFGIKRSDPWGYYNGELQTWQGGDSENSVPYQYFSGHISSHDSEYGVVAPLDLLVPYGSQFRGDTSYINIYTLKTIHYPTGGRTEFSFEPNRYIWADTLATGGGLRVNNIRYYSDASNNMVMQKIYKYGYHENGAGILRTWNNLSNYNYQQTVIYLFPMVYTRGGSTNYNVQDFSTYFTERQRTYATHSFQDLSFSDGSPMVYDTVTEYNIDHGVKTGKTIYQYNYNPNMTLNIRATGNLTEQSDDWQDGGLISTTSYAWVNGKYVWLKRKETDYYAYVIDGVIVGKAFPNNILVLGYSPTYPSSSTSTTYDSYKNYSYLTYGLTTGALKPIHERYYTRDMNDTTHVVKETQNYTYNANLFPTVITTTDGIGNIRTTTTSYTDAFSTDAVLSHLTAANKLNYEVEKVTTLTKGGTASVLSGELHTYATNGYQTNIQEIEPVNPIPLSSFNYAFPAYSGYVLKQSYDGFDGRGNVRQITDKNNIITSYIWDYNGLYPIAGVKNAARSQIAYTGFESTGKGNWKYNLAGITASDSRAGRQCYNLSTGGTITKDSLVSTTTYIVSYWTKNTSSLTIAGTIANTTVLNRTSGNWHYYTQKITGQTSLSISGTGYIDELCLYPSDAEMTTYTYDPLVGVTSSTDAKGETTYYEYDPAQRLINVKDQDGNIVKHLNYHYQGQ